MSEGLRVEVLRPEEVKLVLNGALGEAVLNHLVISLTEAENLFDQLNEAIEKARKS